MPTSQTARKQSNIEFFKAVKLNSILQEAFASHGFDRLDIHSSQHNAVFVITKSAWDIPPPPGQMRGLNIHFEARRRNELRIEIGLYPYIGNVEQKPDLHRELQRVLQQKAAMLAGLRSLLTTVNILPPGILTDTSALLKPEKTKSHTIVKFVGSLPDEPTPAVAAHFFAQIIDAVAPFVEREMANHRRRRHALL